LDLLIARVEREDYVFWQGQLQKAFVVVYRSYSDARSLVGRREKGQLWIDKRGEVLRQQVNLFGSTLKFERMSDTLSQEHWSKAIREIGEVAETSLTLNHDKAFSTKHVTGTND